MTSLGSRKKDRLKLDDEMDDDPPVLNRSKTRKLETDVNWSSCTRFWIAIFFVVAVSSLVIILIVTLPERDGELLQHDSPIRAPSRVSNSEIKNYDFTQYLHKMQASGKREVTEPPQEIESTTGTTTTFSGEFKTNDTHEDNQLDVIIHFTFDSIAAMRAYQTVTIDDSSSSSRKSTVQSESGVAPSTIISPVTNAAECAPGYTVGVNLTLGKDFMIDTSSATTLDPSFAASAVENAVNTWNSFIGKSVFRNRLAWTGTFSENNSNGRNEIVYGSISPTNILAVTIVYGYFSSYPLSQRKIVEFDVIFADASQTLGDATIDPTTHDYTRVAMHEFGHCTGLADVYLTGCDTWTIMYGSSPAGRVQPRAPLSFSDGISIAGLYPDGGIAEENRPNNSTTLNYWSAIYLCCVIVTLQMLLI